MGDERYLRPIGGRGDYFDRPRDPLLAGEALSEDDQRLLTQRAHQAAEDKRRTELGQLLADARREAEHVEALARHARKQVSRLERRLRGS